MPAFALSSCTLCVSPCFTLSCTACGLSLSYRSVLVFEFVLRSLGYCSTRREAESEKGRVVMRRNRMGDRIIVLRNMVGVGSCDVVGVIEVAFLFNSSEEKK